VKLGVDCGLEKVQPALQGWPHDELSRSEIIDEAIERLVGNEFAAPPSPRAAEPKTAARATPRRRRSAS
jgi:hypothetical protein